MNLAVIRRVLHRHSGSTKTFFYRMRPNYLPNPRTNNKNLCKFVNFNGIELKFRGLVGLRCILLVIDVSPLGLDHGLNPGHEPGADVLDRVPGHVDPDLVDGGLEGLGVRVLLDIDLCWDICPYQMVEGPEVWGAGLPIVFGPEIEVRPEPALDHILGVAGGPILHQDRVPGVLEVCLDPWEHGTFQHQLQVLHIPHPEPNW